MINYIQKDLRGKELISYKATLTSFNAIQKDILIGTLLGDASMQAMKGDQESNIKFEQKISQIDYVNHLYEILQDFVGTPPQIRNITGGGAKDRQSVWFRTYKHSLFSFYKELFYKVDENGKQYKIVPLEICKYLTPRALAYWYMDDGTAVRKGLNSVNSFVLNTQGFTYEEQECLVKALKSALDLDANIHKDGKSFKLYIPSRSGQRFIELVKPYIVQSFEYKF